MSGQETTTVLLSLSVTRGEDEDTFNDEDDDE